MSQNDLGAPCCVVSPLFLLVVVLLLYNRRYFQHAHFIPIVGVGKTGVVVVVVVVVVFFTLTDRASTIPSNIGGCQSGTWSAGQKKIRRTSTKLQ